MSNISFSDVSISDIERIADRMRASAMSFEAGVVIALCADRDRLANDLRAEREKVAKLREALGPFVKEEGTWAKSASDDYRPGVTEPNQKTFHARSEFTIGDLRRAREAYEATSKGAW